MVAGEEAQYDIQKEQPPSSSQLDAKDILHAWRDFECSFFAAALLKPVEIAVTPKAIPTARNPIRIGPSPGVKYQSVKSIAHKITINFFMNHFVSGLPNI